MSLLQSAYNNPYRDLHNLLCPTSTSSSIQNIPATFDPNNIRILPSNEAEKLEYEVGTDEYYRLLHQNEALRDQTLGHAGVWAVSLAAWLSMVAVNPFLIAPVLSMSQVKRLKQVHSIKKEMRGDLI